MTYFTHELVGKFEILSVSLHLSPAVHMNSFPDTVFDRISAPGACFKICVQGGGGGGGGT